MKTGACHALFELHNSHSSCSESVAALGARQWHHRKLNGAWEGLPTPWHPAGCAWKGATVATLWSHPPAKKRPTQRFSKRPQATRCPLRSSTSRNPSCHTSKAVLPPWACERHSESNWDRKKSNGLRQPKVIALFGPCADQCCINEHVCPVLFRHDCRLDCRRNRRRFCSQRHGDVGHSQLQVNRSDQVHLLDCMPRHPFDAAVVVLR